MSCCAELIAVGTELLLGNIVNTDAQFLSQQLSELGINVYYHTVVGDNPQRLTDAVELAKSRADIIITTGGLGPTCDDLTKQTLAKCFGLEMEFHQEIADNIRNIFKNQLGAKHMTENNLQQAWLPKGCEIFHNRWGTAPGCAFESQGKHVIMLPGPPRECQGLYFDCAKPYLMKLSDGVIVSRQLRIFGSGESSVEDKLRDLMLTMTNPTLAPYAKEGEVMLRITAKAETEQEGQAMLEPVEEKVREIFGEKVYGTDVESLEQVVVSMLREKNLTLALAESCTGGLVSKRITDIPGCSSVYLGGITAYSNSAKEKLLGVDRQILEQHGAVSQQVAEAMAAGARNALGADIGVGITGIAGPDSDGTDKPVGLVYVAIATESGIECKQLNGRRRRDQVRLMSSSTALDMIRRYLAAF